MLYVSKSFTATVRGSALKGAHCQNCGGDYFYVMECTATGTGESPYMLDNAGASKRSEAQARKNLAKALQGVLPVRCPDCGFYQPEMVKELRGQRTYRYALWIGILVLIIGLIAIAVQVSLFSCYTLLLGGSLLALWWALRSTDDPNSTAHQALQDANSPAIRRDDFIKSMADMPEEQQRAIGQIVVEFDQSKQKLPTAARPQEILEQQLAESQRSARRRMRLGGWLLGTILVGFAIGPIVAYRDEEAAYAKTKGPAGTLNVAAIDRYLRDYPKGSHATELQEARDDENFKLITRSGATEPGVAMTYLKSAANVRHRQEAEKLITDFYAKIGEHANKAATTPQQKELARLINVALQRRKANQTPIVYVSIQGKQTLHSKGVVKEAEDAEAAQYYLSSPEIKKMEDQKPGSSLIDPTPAFDPGMLQAREQTLLAQVANVIRVACNSSQVSVHLATAQTPSDLVLTYETKPAGSLTYWSSTSVQKDFRGVQRSFQESVMGLARNYVVSGELKTADGTPPLAAFSVTPAQTMEYKGNTRDAQWKAYHAMLLSCMYEIGAQLDAAFGQPVRPTPKVFGPNGATR